MNSAVIDMLSIRLSMKNDNATLLYSFGSSANFNALLFFLTNINGAICASVYR